jgi:predicted acyltransferase (DUF342 family)
MIARILTAGLLAVSLSGCSYFVDSFTLSDGATHEGDVSLVNGRITIGRECTVTGTLTSVNGGITVGDGSEVGGVENVNGSIDLGDDVTVNGPLESVNGRISGGSGTRVDGDIESVNGRIDLAEASEVTGTIDSVNGRIELTGVRAAGIRTADSPIELWAGTHITGPLTVRKSSGVVNFGSDSRIRIVIGRDSRVDGPLTFEKPVELYVHDTATVGTIEGAEPIAFSGDTP